MGIRRLSGTDGILIITNADLLFHQSGGRMDDIGDFSPASFLKQFKIFQQGPHSPFIFLAKLHAQLICNPAQSGSSVSFLLFGTYSHFN